MHGVLRFAWSSTGMQTFKPHMDASVVYVREDDARFLTGEEIRARERASERSRIRRGLIDVIADRREETAMARPVGREFDQSDREIGADEAFTLVLAALDRLCPEKE